MANLKVEVAKLDIAQLEKAPSGLNNLESKVHELDVDKLAQLVPPDLSKLSHVVKNDLVKKAVYDELVKNVGTIDAGKLVQKTDYDDEISNAEGNISDITNLATTTILIPVENKIRNANDLVEKADYEAKIKDIEGK